MSGHSAACCSVPPVVAKGYSTKGEYSTVQNMKTYQTGSTGSKFGILVIYDIFGFFPQTLQGADILAYGNKDRSYRVFMPDWFDGDPADISWYPPDTPEKGEKLGNFFKTKAVAPVLLEKIPGVMETLAKENPDIEAWGIVGYCWGGKVANLASMEGTLFKAAAACHPAMVDPSDAPKVTIPIALLPSGDEDKNAVAEYEKALKVKSKVEWFPDQIHGWMAARSDLENPRVKEEYERGYKVLLAWFHETL